VEPYNQVLVNYHQNRVNIKLCLIETVHGVGIYILRGEVTTTYIELWRSVKVVANQNKFRAIAIEPVPA